MRIAASPGPHTHELRVFSVRRPVPQFRHQSLVPSVVGSEAARRAKGRAEGAGESDEEKSDPEEAAAPLLHREASLMPVAQSPVHHTPGALQSDTVSVDSGHSRASRSSKGHASSRGSSSAASSNLRALHSVVKVRVPSSTRPPASPWVTLTYLPPQPAQERASGPLADQTAPAPLRPSPRDHRPRGHHRHRHPRSSGLLVHGDDQHPHCGTPRFCGSHNGTEREHDQPARQRGPVRRRQRRSGKAPPTRRC